MRRWPGSIIEFLKVIGPLTDPPAHGGQASDAFHGVCPSLPGYGFSDKPAATGWGVEKIATLWDELMARLEYERFGVQGGADGGYGLVDSPVALCAWIMEKFWAWTDCEGHPENALTRDELLDNVTLYWLTATGAFSARLYWESFNRRDFSAISVPAGCSIFPQDIYGISRRWAATRFTDLRYWNELYRGGHFPAFEQPERFVNELRSSFRLVR